MVTCNINNNEIEFNHKSGLYGDIPEFMYDRGGGWNVTFVLPEKTEIKNDFIPFSNSELYLQVLKVKNDIKFKKH